MQLVLSIVYVPGNKLIIVSWGVMRVEFRKTGILYQTSRNDRNVLRNFNVITRVKITTTYIIYIMLSNNLFKHSFYNISVSTR
jgi:hypothetical protein